MKIDVEMDRVMALASYETVDESEDSLSGMLSLVGRLMLARRVSLMLLDTVGDEGQQLKLVALHGDLPKSAWEERAKLGQGIAARVLADWQPILIPDINISPLKPARRHPGESGSFIACPVPVAGRPAGVVNISDSISGSPFTNADLARAELAAVLVGRSIHLLRLQGVLDSSFAKMALALEGVTDSDAFISLSVNEPQQVAKILAKTFYREMHRCGFSANQIIHAAGEIISELSASMNRHKQRQQRRSR